MSTTPESLGELAHTLYTVIDGAYDAVRRLKDAVRTQEDTEQRIDQYVAVINKLCAENKALLQELEASVRAINDDECSAEDAAQNMEVPTPERVDAMDAATCTVSVSYMRYLEALADAMSRVIRQAYCTGGSLPECNAESVSKSHRDAPDAAQNTEAPADSDEDECSAEDETESGAEGGERWWSVKPNACLGSAFSHIVLRLERVEHFIRRGVGIQQQGRIDELEKRIDQLVERLNGLNASDCKTNAAQSEQQARPVPRAEAVPDSLRVEHCSCCGVPLGTQEICHSCAHTQHDAAQNTSQSHTLTEAQREWVRELPQCNKQQEDNQMSINPNRVEAAFAGVIEKVTKDK